jgi:hypothetical protein
VCGAAHDALELALQMIRIGDSVTARFPLRHGDPKADLVVIDPAFRWFSPRTMLERAFTDENYATLTAFLRDVPGRLRPGGAVLL